MNIEIIDNFLDKNYFQKINQEFLSTNFPWYFHNGKVYENDGGIQFTHIFYNDYKVNSDYFFILEPLLNLLNIKSLVKIKLNFTPKETVLKQFGFHTDNKFNCKTAIFYLNTNNGKTIFKDLKDVNSVENKLVKFDSNIQHTGTSTTNKPYRMVLNLNYF